MKVLQQKIFDWPIMGGGRIIPRSPKTTCKVSYVCRGIKTSTIDGKYLILVKIHISDQTSLRICNSVYVRTR